MNISLVITALLCSVTAPWHSSDVLLWFLLNLFTVAWHLVTCTFISYKQSGDEPLLCLLCYSLRVSSSAINYWLAALWSFANFVLWPIEKFSVHPKLLNPPRNFSSQAHSWLWLCSSAELLLSALWSVPLPPPWHWFKGKTWPLTLILTNDSFHRYQGEGLFHSCDGLSPSVKTRSSVKSNTFHLSFLILYYLFICLFVFGCVGSLLLCAGFLWLWRAGATLRWGAGFSLRWLLLLQSTGSRHTGFSSCGTWAQSLWLTGSVVVARGL